MSISVYCEGCGKSYSVRDDMAGRKGKCPRGHALQVPAAGSGDELVFEEPAAPARDAGGRTDDRADPREAGAPGAGAFDFTSGDDVVTVPGSKASRRRGDSRFGDSRFGDQRSGEYRTGSRRGSERRRSREDEDDSDSGEFATQELAPRRSRGDDRSTMEMDAPPVAESVVGNAFAFATSGDAVVSRPGSRDAEREPERPTRKGRERRESERDEAPASRRAGPKNEPARRSMLPIIIGGIMAMVGIGVGVAAFLMGRAEIKPLREELAAQTKRAEKAEQAAAAAETAKTFAEARLEEIKKNPPRDPRLAETEKKLAAAERRSRDLQRQLDDLRQASNNPAPKLDPSGGNEMPKDMPKDGKGPTPPANEPGAPKGGKHWNAMPTASSDNVTFMAGDRIWLFPKMDAPIKATAGKASFRLRWQLRTGKQLPTNPHLTILVQEAGFVTQFAVTPINLSGVGGETEVAIPFPKLKGAYRLTFCISDGNRANAGASMIIYSSLLTVDAEF